MIIMEEKSKRINADLWAPHSETSVCEKTINPLLRYDSEEIVFASPFHTWQARMLVLPLRLIRLKHFSATITRFNMILHARVFVVSEKAFCR